MRTTGINAAGLIVGEFSDNLGRGHGFLTDGTTFTTIDVPGGTNTVAYGINTAGQIVGRFDTPGGGFGFLKDGATFITLHPPDGFNPAYRSINNTGQIVGQFSDIRGTHGFLATPAPMDTTPPVITVAASPKTLWPPNGKLVAVTVSGTITDESDGSGVKAGSAVYRVMDEYGQIQPSGGVTPGVGGRCTFIVALQASRRGNDQDGRQYLIAVSAEDNAGNLGVGSTTVTVPHNQGR